MLYALYLWTIHFFLYYGIYFFFSMLQEFNYCSLASSLAWVGANRRGKLKIDNPDFESTRFKISSLASSLAWVGANRRGKLKIDNPDFESSRFKLSLDRGLFPRVSFLLKLSYIEASSWGVLPSEVILHRGLLLGCLPSEALLKLSYIEASSWWCLPSEALLNLSYIEASSWWCPSF